MVAGGKRKKRRRPDERRLVRLLRPHALRRARFPEYLATDDGCGTPIPALRAQRAPLTPARDP